MWLLLTLRTGVIFLYIQKILYSVNNSEFNAIANGEARFLSAEVAGGFTGVYLQPAMAEKAHRRLFLIGLTIIPLPDKTIQF